LIPFSTKALARSPSATLAPRHSKLAAYEWELVELVQAVCHWWSYLWGHPFMIKTNHFSLEYLLDQRMATIPQHKWASKLIGFDFRVEFHPAASNMVVDTLSRRNTEEGALAMVLSAPSFQLFDDLRQELPALANLRTLMEEVRNGSEGEH
jgi:hypothetical protein